MSSAFHCAWAMAALTLAGLDVSPAQTVRELIHTRLEDLMDLQVTSVSRKEQKLSHTGAAIYVITSEDIRRSGATNIPDLLRMAPGVNVAQIDANAWAISIRGFLERYGNKVLVLIDGRSVYSPSLSGVFWDAQDVPLEDIERIEVIRGPGGAVWGANAVNGVINIITRSAKDTRGGLLAVGGGSATNADGVLQYGGAAGPRGAYRAFGRFFRVGSSVLPDGRPGADRRTMGHAGFRGDWDLSPRDSLTLQGDLARLQSGQTYSGLLPNAPLVRQTIDDPIGVTSGNVLGRWNRILAGGSRTSLQIYEDYSHRIAQGFLDAQNTVDVDFQHQVSLGARHELVWGLGSRVTQCRFGAGYSLTFVPRTRTDLLLSTFAEDEIRLTRSVALTVGAKFQRNSYTGFEVQPRGQLVWTPAKDHTIWASAARAIRQPSALDSSFQVSEPLDPTAGAPPAVSRIMGNPQDLRSEDLDEFEAGYRAQAGPRLSLDVAAFLSVYPDLRTAEPQSPFFTNIPPPLHMVLPLVFANKGRARDYGAEFFLNWSATNRWRISPGYSLLHMNVTTDPSSRDSDFIKTPGLSPRHQFQLRSALDLPRHLEWDSSLSYVGRLNSENVPGYTRVDTRLGWRWGESLEFSVVGQNLLTPRHGEFYDKYSLRHTLIERSVFAKVTRRF